MAASAAQNVMKDAKTPTKPLTMHARGRAGSAASASASGSGSASEQMQNNNMPGTRFATRAGCGTGTVRHGAAGAFGAHGHHVRAQTLNRSTNGTMYARNADTTNAKTLNLSPTNKKAAQPRAPAGPGAGAGAGLTAAQAHANALQAELMAGAAAAAPIGDVIGAPSGNPAGAIGAPPMGIGPPPIGSPSLGAIGAPPAAAPAARAPLPAAAAAPTYFTYDYATGQYVAVGGAAPQVAGYVPASQVYGQPATAAGAAGMQAPYGGMGVPA